MHDPINFISAIHFPKLKANENQGAYFPIDKVSRFFCILWTDVQGDIRLILILCTTQDHKSIKKSLALQRSLPKMSLSVSLSVCFHVLLLLYRCLSIFVSQIPYEVINVKHMLGSWMQKSFYWLRPTFLHATSLASCFCLSPLFESRSGSLLQMEARTRRRRKRRNIEAKHSPTHGGSIGRRFIFFAISVSTALDSSFQRL